MASLEVLSASLELTEQKKNSLRKAILLLALEWKDFEKHLESIQQAFEESWCKIDSKEKHLELIRKSAIESNEEVELLRISVRERFEELEVKEKEFRLFQQKHIREFKLKEEKLGSIRKSVEERLREVELREEKLCVHQKLVEGLFEKLELKHKQFEPIQRLMNERFKEINVKEKHFESRSRELHLIQDWIERRAKELDTKEESLEERCKELEVKEKHLDSAKKLNDEWSGKLDSRGKKFDLIENFGPQCFKDFQLEKKQLKSKENLLEQRSKELELKEKQLEDRSKELQLKEEKFANVLHSSEEIEQPEYMPPDNRMDCSYADIPLCMTMDGKSLQIFLNERSNRHDAMSGGICRALRLWLDSAKLVLNAMEGFYPPHLKKGDTEFEGNVVRRSCILLLEQLMTISPLIRPQVKEAALKLAHEWKVKMGTAVKNSLEVLGFLQLLASYKLTSQFDADELWNLFEIVAEHKAAPKLCQVLGFADKISDFIQKLIEREQWLAAIKYIYAYGLVEKFPPVPLLKGYLTYSEEIANKICNKGNNSLEAQDRATKREVYALTAVIKCITDHGLESDFSAKNLKTRIEKLERKNADRSVVVPHPASEAQAQERARKKFITPTPAPSSEAQPQKEYGKKCIAPAFSSEAQPQKQAGENCINPESEAKVQKKAEKKRIAPTPASASNTQPQHQLAKKRPRKAISKAAASRAPDGSAYPVHSTHPPPQRPACFFSEQGAPDLRPPAEYCRPRGSTPYYI
ncbi:FRIGIDA-like protein 1 [Cornus florida]|uniref:FRIGIDA-like protein 1 n=1 Tax=Cornus florida TaxID=4283 RepID=UPI00289DF891|nr:FRIGIDA-like protein 1 [Cornus florida]